MIGALTAKSASQGDPHTASRAAYSCIGSSPGGKRNARHLKPTLLQFSCVHQPKAVVETLPSLFLRSTCNNRESRARGSRAVSDADSVPGTGMWNTLSLSEACQQGGSPGSCSGILGGHKETFRSIPHKVRPFLALWRRSSLYQNNRYAFVPEYSSLLVISSRIIVVAYCYGPQVSLLGRGNPTRHHV
jgi:hypothetical protein